MSIDFASPKVEIPRDRYDRPMVVPPTGGKAVAYTRCTTYVDCIEDKFKLQQWEKRMVATGLSLRPDLLLAVAAHRNDKDKLDEICGQAKEAAEASAAATTGTALHSLTEQYDRGLLDITKVPAAYRPDIEAYARATEGVEHLHIESFTVHDGFKVGGTPDRVVTYEGRNYIWDLKTGQVDFGALKIAMQLAMYSRSVMYDPATHERTPLPKVDQEWGIVAHLPAGEGTCRLLRVDIRAGWEVVQVARAVRENRKRRGLMEELTAATSLAPEPTLLDLIDVAASEDDLYALYQRHFGEWTDEHTRAAGAKKAQLLGGAA
jgi:hypothetical protein